MRWVGFCLHGLENYLLFLRLFEASSFPLKYHILIAFCTLKQLRDHFFIDQISLQKQGFLHFVLWSQKKSMSSYFPISGNDPFHKVYGIKIFFKRWIVGGFFIKITSCFTSKKTMKNSNKFFKSFLKSMQRNVIISVSDGNVVIHIPLAFRKCISSKVWCNSCSKKFLLPDCDFSICV